jgi:hypothetical protein
MELDMPLPNAADWLDFEAWRREHYNEGDPAADRITSAWLA